MLPTGNRNFEPQAALEELTVGTLLAFLEDHTTTPLIFHYDERPVRAGYHVTEVKAGEFRALDCEANAEAWTEIFVQLWDVDEGGPQHMPAGKFAAIVRKVAEAINLETSAKLTFEVSDGIRPMQLHHAGKPRVAEDGVHVYLSPRPASCKPRDRWLEADKAATTSGCCGTSSSACCGTPML